MKTTVKRITTMAPAPAVEAAAPVEAVLTASEHARAALLAGGFAAAGVMALGGAAMYFLPPLRSHWPDLVVFSGLAGSCTAAWFGLAWVRTAAVRSWSVDDQERQRRWWFEDQEFGQDEPAPVLLPVSPAERLRLAGLEVLALHYVDGAQATREEAEALGVGQREWNAVNTILKALKVKTAKGWGKLDYSAALALWRSVVWHGEGVVFVPDADGKGKKRVEL